MTDLPAAELHGTPELLAQHVVGDLLAASSTNTKPGVGAVLDATLIDALVSIAFRSEQGGLLWHGWLLGKGLPPDRVYSLKVGAGKITDSAPKPPGNGAQCQPGGAS